MAERDDYILCVTEPANVPGTGKVAFAATAANNFQDIGFEPSGNVYFSYGVANVAAAAATPPEYLIFAQGDLDADGTAGAAAQVGATAANTAAALAIATGAAANDSLFTQDDAGSFVDQHPGVY